MCRHYVVKSDTLGIIKVNLTSIVNPLAYLGIIEGVTRNFPKV